MRRFAYVSAEEKRLFVLQGLSVAVDVFTLVCISVERYIAICRPLLILKLQSLRFGNLFNALILFFIWFLALLTALPNLLIYNLCSFPALGRFKCEKVNPKSFDERIYMITLDSRRDLLLRFRSSLVCSLLLSSPDRDHGRSLRLDHLQDVQEQHGDEDAFLPS